MKVKALILMLSICFTSAQAQEVVKDVEFDAEYYERGNEVALKDGIHNVTVSSEILSEDREINIYLPQGYVKGTEQYPVLYVLDGENEFNHTTTIVEVLSQSRRIPQMIVVGIPNLSLASRARDLTYPSKNEIEQQQSADGYHADIFLEFLESEVIFFVDKSYRTNSFRVLAGKSRAGYFTINTMLSKPDLFGAYIAPSAMIGWNYGITLEKAKSVFASESGLNTILYLSLANESLGLTESVIQPVHRFVELLQQNAPSNLDWGYDYFPNESHNSTSHMAFYNGLLKVYDAWSAPQFSSIADYKAKGGIEFVRRFHQKVEKLGYPKPEKLSPLYIMSIAALYRKEQDFEGLRAFIENDPDVNSSILRRVGTWFYYWPAGYAKESIGYFTLWAKRAPNISAPWIHLSYAYDLLGDTKQSHAAFTKAKQIAVQYDDADFEYWKGRYLPQK